MHLSCTFRAQNQIPGGSFGHHLSDLDPQSHPNGPRMGRTRIALRRCTFLHLPETHRADPRNTQTAMILHVSAPLRELRTREAQEQERSVTACLGMILGRTACFANTCQNPMSLHVFAHSEDAAMSRINLVRHQESPWACMFLGIPLRKRGSPGNTRDPIIDVYSH